MAEEAEGFVTDVEEDEINRIMSMPEHELAAELAKEGIHAEVIDLRTVRPIDYETVINSVKKTNRLVLIEESWPLGSIATEIAFKVQKDAFDYLDAPVRRITSLDAPMHYAPNLVAQYLPDVPRTVNLVKEVMYLKK